MIRRLARHGIGPLLCLGLTACATPPARILPDGKQWSPANVSVETPGSFCYDDDPSKCARYGRLYTWDAARKVCASMGSGWRLPSMDDWRTLARFHGGLFGDGTSDGKTAFRELQIGGRSGLDLLLGGGRDNPKYARLEAHGFYWSTTEESPAMARLLNLGKGNGAAFDQDGGEKARAYSVRCVRNSQ